jgi:hypothetical protein
MISSSYLSMFLAPTRCSTLTTFTLVSFSYLSTVFAPIPAVVAGGPSSPASGAPAPTQDLRLRHETSVPGEHSAASQHRRGTKRQAKEFCRKGDIIKGGENCSDRICNFSEVKEQGSRGQRGGEEEK